jgi:sensor c-di-GMP phosphodiesterase-like protein
LHNKRVAVVIAILAITAPILISLYLARQQSVDEQTSRVAHIADDVLRRSDEVVFQAQAVGAKLATLSAADACSDDTIAVMSRIAVASEQLQAFTMRKGGFLPDPCLSTNWKPHRNGALRREPAVPRRWSAV